LLTLWLGLYIVAMIIYRVSLWCIYNMDRICIPEKSHTNVAWMFYAQGKTLTDMQILGCELSELNQNAFGGRAPPGPIVW